jgi:hypothetical protein
MHGPPRDLQVEEGVEVDDGVEIIEGVGVFKGVAVGTGVAVELKVQTPLNASHTYGEQHCELEMQGPPRDLQDGVVGDGVGVLKAGRLHR